MQYCKGNMTEQKPSIVIGSKEKCQDSEINRALHNEKPVKADEFISESKGLSEFATIQVSVEGNQGCTQYRS